MNIYLGMLRNDVSIPRLLFRYNQKNLAFWMQKLYLFLGVSRLLLQYVVLDPPSIQIDRKASINFSNTSVNF